MDPVPVWAESAARTADAEPASVGAGSVAQAVQFVAAYELKGKSFWLR